MQHRILVPLDGSELSERIIPWVRLFAQKSPGTRVTLVRAFELPGTIYLLPDLALPTSNALSEESIGNSIVQYLERAALRIPDCEVNFEVLIGDPAGEILAKSEEHDLIMMASHGHGGLGRWLLGSVATKLARGATVPILCANSAHVPAVETASVERILVPLDGSDVAERAFDKANELARKLGAKLFLYQSVSQVDKRRHSEVTHDEATTVFAKTYLEKLAASVEGAEVEWKVVENFGRTGILNHAKEIEADLIVMGSHGKSGLERWMLGSESERVLHNADCPVLLIH